MESRIYEEKFMELRSKISIQLKNKNNKTSEYQKRTIEEYFNALSNGDFSQKNFKSKIAYFKGQKDKYYDEVSSTISDANKEVKEFLDGIMVQMEAEKDNLEIQERRNDLLEINATVKRLRQDNANRMSAIDKEFQTKLKEAQAEFDEQEKISSSYSNDLNKKMSVEMQKVIEAFDEKISPLASSLLLIDEKNKINEVKKKISEYRLSMLEEEEKIELSFNDKEKEEKSNNLKVLKESKLKLEMCKAEYRLLKIKNSRDNDLLSLESDTNIFNYDTNKKDKGFDLINDIYRRKIDYFYVIRDQKRNVYAKELSLKKKYNDKLFLYASINSIHPFLTLIDFILKEFDEYAKYFDEAIEKQNNFKLKYVKKISDLIMGTDLSHFQGKAKERKLFDDQVRRDVNKFLDSDLLNNEYNLIIDSFDRILNLFPLNNSKIDKKDKYLNNIYLSESNINRYDSIEKFEAYMNFVEAEFDKYRDNYLSNRNKDINRFNENSSNKISKINTKYYDGMNDTWNNYMKLNEELTASLNKEISGIKKEFDLNKKRIENSYKQKRLTV